MPLEPETGIYRAPSKKVLSPHRVASRPSKGKIAKWDRTKRNNFEREILAQQKSLKQIAKDYDIAYQTAVQWKIGVLQPAVRAAQQQHDIEEQSAAMKHLSFIYEVSRDAITDIVKGKEVTNPETGEVTREPVDPRIYGTLAQHIGQGVNLAKALGEFTGELVDVANSKPAESMVIRCIQMPKLAGVEISMQTRQRPTIELSAVPEDDTAA